MYISVTRNFSFKYIKYECVEMPFIQKIKYIKYSYIQKSRLNHINRKYYWNIMPEPNFSQDHIKSVSFDEIIDKIFVNIT